MEDRVSASKRPSGALTDSNRFNGVKVISATMVAERQQLGEKVTAWMASHPQCKVTDIVVTQSSDDSFHCVACSIFYWEDPLNAAKRT